MNAIEQELQKATGVKPKAGEKRSAYLNRVSIEAEKLSDAKFDALSEAAQEWLNAASEECKKATSRGKEPLIEDFEDGDADVEPQTKPAKAPKASKVAAKATEDEDDEDVDADDKEDDRRSTLSAVELDEEDAKESDVAKTKKGKTAPKKAAKVAKAKAPTKVKEPKVAKAAKALKAAKANGAAKKSANGSAKVGVMAEIQRMLQRSEGATVKEVAAALVKKFPDRKETTLIASTRWFVSVGSVRKFNKKPKKTEDAKRGRVFTLPSSL